VTDGGRQLKSHPCIALSVKFGLPPGNPPDFFTVNTGAQSFEPRWVPDYNREAAKRNEPGIKDNSAIQAFETILRGNLIEHSAPVLYPTDWRHAQK
jgi:hypothetical protein